MGNSSSFKPKQIDLATFTPSSLETIQKNIKLKRYIQSNFKRKLQQQIIFQEGSQSYIFWQVSHRDLSLNDLQILLSSLGQVKFTNIYFHQLQYYFHENNLQRSKQKHNNKQFNLLKSLCYPYFVDLLILSVSHCNIKSLQSIQFLNTPKLKTLYLKYNPFINFKSFNKCRFKSLKYLDIQHNATREVFYLSNFTRCDLNQQIGHISLDDDYQLTKSYPYNHLQKPKQSIDLSAMVKWNSKNIYNMSIRQIDCLNNSNDLLRLQYNQSYQFKIRQKIIQKYRQIYFGIVQEQSIQEIFSQQQLIFRILDI